MVHSFTIDLETGGDGDTIDITGRISDKLAESGLDSGIVTVFVPGSTGAVTTIEFEQGVIEDLAESIDRNIPQDLFYEHHQRWQDGNGHSHVRSAWFGPSLTIPFVQGQLTLGTWQQIVLIDFDNRPRHRHIVVQIIGE